MTLEHIWQIVWASGYDAGFWARSIMLAVGLVPWIGLLDRQSGVTAKPARILGLVVLVYLYGRLQADFAFWSPIVPIVILIIGFFRLNGRSAPRSRKVILLGYTLLVGLVTIGAVLRPDLSITQFAVCVTLTLVFANSGSDEDGSRRNLLTTLPFLICGYVLWYVINGVSPSKFIPFLLIGIVGWMILAFTVWADSRDKKTKSKIALVISGTAWTNVTLLLLCVVTELYFVHLYDTTDANRSLKICHIWWRRHVRLNSWGTRDREYEPISQFDDHTRIVIIGDSFGFGRGITETSDLLGPLLEASLKKQLPEGPAVTVFNLSREGIGTAQELDRYEKVGRKLKPHAVLLIYLLNDVGDSVPFKAENHPGLEPWEPLRKASVGLDFLIWHAYVAWFYEGRRDWPVELSYYDDPVVFGKHRRNIEGMIEAVREDGAEIVVALYPFLGLPTGTGPQRTALDKLTALFAEYGVSVIDVSQSLDTTNPTYILNPFDGHPSVQLNREIAPIMARQLAEVLSSASTEQKEKPPDA